MQDNNIVTFLSSAAAVQLGELDFDPGTPNVRAGSSLSQTVQAAGLGSRSPAILTFTRPGDPPTSEPLQQQALVAANQAGATVVINPVANFPVWRQFEGSTAVGWPDCPFVTVIPVLPDVNPG